MILLSINRKKIIFFMIQKYQIRAHYYLNLFIGVSFFWQLYLPLQGSELHVLHSWLQPTQFLPLHKRRLIWKPSSQLLLHSSQAPQDIHWLLVDDKHGFIISGVQTSSSWSRPMHTRPLNLGSGLVHFKVKAYNLV